MSLFSSIWKGVKKVGKAVGNMLGVGGSVAGHAIDANTQRKINEANIRSQESINQQNIDNQQRINQQNIDWAQKNYEQSRDDSLERWKMENEYNSPAKQMERLAEGGLNPHLVYGTGAEASGGTIDSPQYNTPNLQAPNLQSVDHGQPVGVGNILSGALMHAQIEKTRAESRRINVDQEDKAVDLAVKKSLGYDKLRDNLNLKMSSENHRNVKLIREFEAWAEASFKDTPADAELYTDHLGTYSTKGLLGQSAEASMRDNVLIEKVRRAGYDKTLQDIVNLKKRMVLYDDQHALNQIDIKLRDFTKQLTNLGINPQSTQAMSVIVQMLRLAFGK